jgi:C1A family cysteine protease
MSSSQKYNIVPSEPDKRNWEVEFPTDMTCILDPHTKEVRATVNSTPLFYSLRPYFYYIFNQGSLGSCTANASCQYYGFLLKKPFTPFSRLFQYWNTRNLMGKVQVDSGASVKDTVKIMCSVGICLETHWPYTISKFKLKPPITAYNAIQRLPKGSSYVTVPVTPTQWQSALLSGHPIIFGMHVFQQFESVTTSTRGIISYPTPNERYLGGHCMLCTGYNSTTNSFEVLNSWGVRWGSGGYCYLPFEYLTKLYKNKTPLIFDAWIVISP